MYHVDMHCADGCSDYRKFLWWRTSGFGGWVESEKKLTESFHDYAGEWTLGEIVFYKDGEETDQWGGKLDHPGHVILNLGIKGGRQSTSGFNGPVDDSTPFPSRFEAEFVRRYERVDEGWETKESARLKKKGIKKKKRSMKKIRSRVSSSVRIFEEGRTIRVEHAGGPKTGIFRILDPQGEELAVLVSDEQGWSHSLRKETTGRIELVGEMGGRVASMWIELSD